MDKLRDFLKSWPGRILMMLCLTPMVFLGLDSYFSSGRLQADEIARVGDTPISLASLQDEFNANRSQLASQVEASRIDDKALNQETLDNLINRALLGEQAKRLGMQVSDTTLATLLRQDAAFLDSDGKFSDELFAQFLQRNGLNKDRLFEIQRGQINVRQLMNGILLSAIYPSAKVEHLISLQTKSRPLWVKRLSWQNYSDQVSVSDAEIDAYYNAHKDSLVSPEMVDLSYIELKASDAKSQAVSEDDLKQAYQDHLKANNLGQKELAQILVSADNDKKIGEIEQKLAQGESFEALAKTYSDDPSGKNGGSIGAYNASVFGADAKKVDAAIALLQVGEVSKPVQTAFGTHFFKVTGMDDAPSFDSLKDELTAKLTQDKAVAAYNELISIINNKAADSYGLKDIADELKLELKKIDNYKAVGQEILGQPAIAKEAFDPFNIQDGSVSNAISLSGSTLWVQSANHRPSAPMTLEDARAEIKERLIKQKATALALADAQKLAAAPMDLTGFDKIEQATLHTAVLNAAEQSSLFLKDTSDEETVAWAVETDTGASILVGGKIDNAVPMSTEQKVAAGAMIRSIAGQDYLEDYLYYLKEVHQVQMNDELLKTL